MKIITFFKDCAWSQLERLKKNQEKKIKIITSVIYIVDEILLTSWEVCNSKATTIISVIIQKKLHHYKDFDFLSPNTHLYIRANKLYKITNPDCSRNNSRDIGPNSSLWIKCHSFISNGTCWSREYKIGLLKRERLLQ